MSKKVIRKFVIGQLPYKRIGGRIYVARDKVTERIEVCCKNCGYNWNPLGYSLLSGKECPHCSALNGAKKRNNKLSVKTTEQFKKELSEKNRNISVLGEYINNKTKISVECLVCGNKRDVVPASLLNGHGCPQCGKRRKKTD